MSKLTITPYGGLGEIGMNCLLIETDKSAILIDCGLMFSELDHFGVEFVIPNFSHLLRKKDKIKAIIATHGHEDHIGAISFAVKAGLRAPIYASHFTSLMVRERLREVGMHEEISIKVFNSGGPVQLGDFTVTPASVNHSIIDSMALFIDTPAGKIVHTGDFKLDASPFFGDVFEWDMFKKAGDEGVFLLLSDSTNVEREDHHLLDTNIAQRLEELFVKAQGLIVVSLFSSNVGRMANIFKIAKKLGRKIALSGRSMEQNVRLAHERGAINLDSSLMIPIDDVHRYDRNRVVVLSTGCQGEPRSALNRMAHGEHADVTLGEGDLVIMSSSQIPGNEVAISRLINQLFTSGADVLYDAIEDVHTSGHATRPELKKMIEMVRPKYFIPVHGEYRHLVHHARLAAETGVAESNIAVIKNGEITEIGSKVGIKIIDKLEELRILVSGRDGTEVTRDLLRDRRKLAETGVVFCMMVREKDSGKILTKPELMLKGVVSESFESWMMDEAMRIVHEQIGEYKKGLKRGFIDPEFGENLRIEIRRFFDRNTGKKPIVVPVLLDV
ncbi:MAG: ribonuclease J [Bdellovibrionales bacterium]|nr:ribonuclease J [Bdellovibrionales bacterium]